MTRHGVGLTRDEREEPLARAGRGGDGAAETRRVNLLLAVDAEATRACPSTAGMAHDPKERPVGEGSGGVLARKVGGDVLGKR